MVSSFKYLGRVLLAVDYDWPAVIQNLMKAWEVWRRMVRILSREGTRLQVSGSFFKGVVHMVFLLLMYMWVVIPILGQVLGVSKISWCGK